MKYRLELKDHGDKDPVKVWTENFWTALVYFLQEVPEVTDTPSHMGRVKTKLLRGRKILVEICSRKGWYPYYVKVHKGLTKEEYKAVDGLIRWNILHNQGEEDRYRGTTEIKDWHEYLTELKAEGKLSR